MGYLILFMILQNCVFNAAQQAITEHNVTLEGYNDKFCLLLASQYVEGSLPRQLFNQCDTVVLTQWNIKDTHELVPMKSVCNITSNTHSNVYVKIKLNNSSSVENTSWIQVEYTSSETPPYSPTMMYSSDHATFNTFTTFATFNSTLRMSEQLSLQLVHERNDSKYAWFLIAVQAMFQVAHKGFENETFKRPNVLVVCSYTLSLSSVNDPQTTYSYFTYIAVTAALLLPILFFGFGVMFSKYTLRNKKITESTNVAFNKEGDKVNLSKTELYEDIPEMPCGDNAIIGQVLNTAPFSTSPGESNPSQVNSGDIYSCVNTTKQGVGGRVHNPVSETIMVDNEQYEYGSTPCADTDNERAEIPIPCDNQYSNPDNIHSATTGEDVEDIGEYSEIVSRPHECRTTIRNEEPNLNQRKVQVVMEENLEHESADSICQTSIPGEGNGEYLLQTRVL